MRYIGNKENILNQIDTILRTHGVQGESFFDFFSGTTSVAQYYKRLGYRVFSSDLMYLSYCMQKAYIENNSEPEFTALLPTLDFRRETIIDFPLHVVADFLNQLPPVKGFIYQNYTPGGTASLKTSRQYFSDENGCRIDAIRQKIEQWKTENLLTESEYFILLTCLIETVSLYANVSGVYAAFQKKWDPRAVKPLILRTIKTISNQRENQVFNVNSMELCSQIEADILYLDPPYNERQYAPNYHLLETITRYDNPVIHGVTGMRDYKMQKSTFCNPKTALESLEFVARNARYRFLVLSYNSEGIMLEKEILRVLSQFGKVTMEQFEYTRFKSNSHVATAQKHVYEQLYILSK
ncbi:MAG: DNA adenine methylase [Planctomycetia bacterium]|nr:DNA adenine methylase [Planctomycetia bacterium]